MAENLLSLRNVFVRYGGLTAVWDVSLHVATGELVAIIGANGAGKTSLVRGIAGEAKCRGEVCFRGHSIVSRSTSRIARLGFAHVPQGRRLFADMTVLENLLLGSYRRNVDVERELANVFLLFPRIEQRIYQRAGLLSGGEQQMLAIGRALMSAPALIAMDEPSFGLAPKLVAELFEKVQEIRSRGMSVLLIEQNAVRALDVSDRVYVMEQGSVVYSGVAEAAARELDVMAAYMHQPTNGSAGSSL